MDAFASMRMDFNRYLLDAIGGKVLDSTIFSWDAGLTKWLLGLCMAVAFFQSVLKDEKSMLVEWTKVVIASWFAMAILGGVDYNNVPGLAAFNKVPAAYQVKSRTKPTLERALFNYLAFKFDSLGQAIINFNGGGEQKSLAMEIRDLGTIQNRIIDALVDCQSHDIECLRKVISGEPRTASEQVDSIPTSPWEIPAWIVGKVGSLYLKMANPAYWLFPILTWILELVRGFVNMFVLISFGIVAALGLFFLKILSVFMVIPSYRGRVLSMWKTAMAASMYGFAMNLMIWISLIITQALNEASVNIALKSITSVSSLGGAMDASNEIGAMVMANFLTSFVIMAMQIVALAKVPSFCNKLMNLSLEEIVNIGENLMSAGLGMAKVLGGAALALGTAGLGAGAAFAAKATTGKTLGELGTSAGDFFKSKLGGATSAEQKAMHGLRAGSGGSDDRGLESSSLGYGPSGGGGRGGSLESAALADANMKATIKGSNKSILKKNEVPQKPDRPKTEFEKKVDRSDMIDKAASMAKAYLPKSIGKSMMNLAFDGLAGGLGGDPTGGIRDMISSTSKTFVEQVEEVQPHLNNKMEEQGQDAFEKNRFVNNKFNPFRKLDTSQRANNAEKVYRQAVVGGKRDQTEADRADFEKNMQAIAMGSANNDQMLSVLQAQNTMNLDQGQKESIMKAKESSKDFRNFANDEDAANHALMQNIKKELSGNGQMTDRTIKSLAERTSAGMIDYDAIKNMEVDSKDGKEKTSMGSALSATANKGMADTLNPLLEKINKGKGISQEEQLIASQMFEKQQSRLVGDKENLDKFNKVLAGKAETKHLETSREDATYVVEETLREINKAMETGSLEAKLGNGMQISMGSTNEKGLVRATGEMDGLYVQGQAVTSKEDYDKLDGQGKLFVDQLAEMVKLVSKDKEAANMLKDNTTDLKFNSDQLKKIQDLVTKIKGNS